MTFRFGKMRVKVHPAMGIWFGLSIALGHASAAMAAALALAMHETGHFLAARCFRLPVTRLEIMPFGAVMRIEGVDAAPTWQSFLTAAGGPAASLIGCMLSPVLLRLSLIPYGLIRCFARCSLLLFAVNLLPALPLDGGRMLEAVLSRFFSQQSVDRALIGAGYIMGAALCALSFFYAMRGMLLLPPAFAGLYLIYAAAVCRRQSGMRYISSLIARRNRLDSTIPLPVELLAARADMPLRALLPYLHSGKYHLVLLLPPNGVGLLGVTGDQQLADALMRSPETALTECEKMIFHKKPDG